MSDEGHASEEADEIRDLVRRPHDALFGRIFSSGENARVLLEGALAPEILSLLDLDSLVPLRAKTHSDVLDERDADLLFQTRTLSGHEVCLRLLIEHQSSQQWLMANRISDYKARDTAQWIVAHENLQTIPPTLAVVVYHGEKPWEAPRRLSELYGLPPAELELLRPHLRNDGYFLEDLTRYSEDELRSRNGPPAALLALLLMREVRRTHPDVLGVLRRAAPLLKALLPNSGRVLLAFVIYSQVTAKVDVRQLTDLARETMGEQEARTVTTTADLLMAEGRRQLILRQLEVKFPGLPPEIRERVAQGSDEELMAWGERFVTATTLEQVFAAE